MDRWKRIRLELARTTEFPRGSVSRGYLIQLPLDGDGRVDGAALAVKPHRATVRRYWSSEPDEIGLLVAREKGWGIRCSGALDRMLLLDDQPLRVGERLFVAGSDGTTLPFKIASIG